MASMDVSPGGFSAAYAQATTGNVLTLLPGFHDLGTSRFTFNKNITIRGFGVTPGQFVTGSNGHNFDNIPVRLRGNFQFESGSAGATFEGFGWYDTGDTGPGTAVIRASNLTFQDLVFSNRRAGSSGTIGFTVGSPTRVDNVQFKRIRFRLCGNPAENDHDHPLYIKNCSNTLVEDCIFYEITDGWCLHFYPNGDNTLVRRCVMWSVTNGITFSGAADSSTGLSGCLASDNNIVETSIISNGTRSGGWLIESYWGCSTIGVGNIVRNSDVYDDGAGGRISTTNGGFSTQNLLSADPLYANPSGGDFTLASNSPALGMGPTYIQPGGNPNPPPTGVSGTTASSPGSGQITVSWTNPATVTNEIRVYRATGGYITDPTSASPVFTDSTDPYATSFADSGLVDGTTYYYSVYVVNGGLYSSPGQASAVPAGSPGPDPEEPAPGEDKVGIVIPGTTGYKGMSPDVKRGSVFQVPANKRITSFFIYLRGTGTNASSTQPMRAIVYNDTTAELLGVSAERSIAENITTGWYEFTPSSPIECPPAGGNILLGMHTGTRTDTPTGEVQYAYTDKTAGLRVAADTYSDGTLATFIQSENPAFEMSICAVIEDVPVGPGDIPLEASIAASFHVTGNLTEETPGGTDIPSSDVVYRMVSVIREYQIPTPFQVSTGAELYWDSSSQTFKYVE